MARIDPQPPQGPLALLVQVLERAGDLIDRRPQPLEQAQAGVGHRHAAGRAVQQAHPETLLQLPHRMAERRRRDAEPRRRGAKAQRASAIATNAVRSARSPRSIHEFLSIPNAIDMGFSFRIRATLTAIVQSGIEEGCMPADATIVSLRSDTAETPAARREPPREPRGQPPREQPEQPATRAAGAAAREPSVGARKGRREVSAPALAALGAVCAAAARADRRRLLVRHRRPGDVDRRRLCRSRQGRHLDRRLRHRQGGRRHGEPARRRPARSCSASMICRSARARPRRGAGRHRAQRSQRAQGELPGHAGADQAGAGRHRLLRPRIPPSAGSRGQERRVAADLRHRAAQPAERATEARLAQRSSSPPIAANLNGDPEHRGRAASALSRRRGAARRSRAPARPHRREGAVRRHRDQCAVDRARQVSRGLDHRLLSRRDRTTSGSTPTRRRPS